MPSKMTIEFYPLWMKENPDLFAKFRVDFLDKATEGGLNSVKMYWQNGLFYMEAVK